jgi:PPOX class probable FMN-dependent enzyme
MSEGATGAEFVDVITTEAELREHYRQPPETTQRKRIDHLDDHCRAFIDHATFVLLGSRASDGTADVSPKGGPPGFVVTLDSHRLAIPDLAGNNLLDTFTNLLADPAIGLLFVIPGQDETLRVNGTACIVRDDDVLDACSVKDRRPTAAIGVTVHEAFIHCAKAFRRGVMWKPDDWPDRHDLASAACMLRDHIELDVAEDDVDTYLEAGYEKTMWEPGG